MVFNTDMLHFPRAKKHMYGFHLLIKIQIDRHGITLRFDGIYLFIQLENIILETDDNLLK